LGGNDFTFNAIFNVADMAISTGVGYDIFSIKKRSIRVKEDKKKTDSDRSFSIFNLVHSV
jgi:lipoprotein signal peptidase